MNRTDQMVLKFREVLKETERLGPDGLWAYQENLLEPLLLHARKHVPFYRERLDAVFDGEKIDYSRWSEIPILTRSDAQHNGKALKAAMVPPHLGTVGENRKCFFAGKTAQVDKMFAFHSCLISNTNMANATNDA